MNAAQLFPNEIHAGCIPCGIAIIAQGREMCGFILFLQQYFSARAFVFAKNGAKPRIAAHGLTKARRIPEQFLPYFISAPTHFKYEQVIFCNAATIACYMRCTMIHYHKNNVLQ